MGRLQQCPLQLPLRRTVSSRQCLRPCQQLSPFSHPLTTYLHNPWPCLALQTLPKGKEQGSTFNHQHRCPGSQLHQYTKSATHQQRYPIIYSPMPLRWPIVHHPGHHSHPILRQTALLQPRRPLAQMPARRRPCSDHLPSLTMPQRHRGRPACIRSWYMPSTRVCSSKRPQTLSLRRI